MNGARVTKQDAKCGAALDLNGGELIIRGQTLSNRGIDAITIAMWVKVRNEKRDLSLFNVDSKTLDGSGAVLALEIKDGRLHWSHVDETGEVVFHLETVQKSTMPVGLWSHVAATYDPAKGFARLYIDSQFIKEVQGNGKMSSQFNGKISIGRDGSLPGLVDEFYFFEKALSFNDVKDLSELCNVGGDYPIPMENAADLQRLSTDKNRKTEVGNRHSKVAFHEDDTDDTRDNCRKQIAFHNTDLRGSETSGVFTDVGDVTSLDECVERCCASKECHIAYMKKRRCFTVVCHFPSLCQPVKVGRSLVHVAFVNRNGESVYIKDEAPNQLDTSNENGGDVSLIHHLTTSTTTTTTSTAAPTNQLRRCLQSNVYYGVALKGGWTSGKFTDKGIVPDLKTCVNHCCDEPDCDLVMLLSQKCFTIHCYSLDDCQTTPNGHAHIAYVARDGYHLNPTTRSPTHTRPKPRISTEEPHSANGPTRNGPPVSNHAKYPSMSGKRPDMVLHYTFEKLDEDLVIDESSFNNNGKLLEGASVSPDGGIRGNGVSFFGGAILLDSQTFKPKPLKAITVALWVKLQDVVGRNTLFATMGQNERNGFRLTVIDGKISWLYVIDGHEKSFQLRTGPILTRNKWFQITATADGDVGEAKVYVNGGIQSIGVTHGQFSSDWGVKAGFGVHEGGHPLHGIMDDMYVFSSALSKDEVLNYIKKFDEMRFLMTPVPVTVPVTRRPTPTSRKTTIKIKTFKPSTTTTTTTTTPPTTTTTSTTTTTIQPTTFTTLSTKTVTKPLSLQQNRCKFGNVYEYTDLKGGLGAGNFLDRGITPNVQVCMELCCAHNTCDLAYVVSSRCYLVECYTTELCSVVPKGLGSVSPVIGMIIRPDGPKIPQLGDNVVLPPTRPWTTNEPGVTPDSLKNMKDLKMALEDTLNPFKHKKKTPKKCIFKKTLSKTTFVGGLKAGNFTNKGTVTSMSVCKAMCCQSDRCDVAVMMKNGCFLLTCKSAELCKPRKAQTESFTLKLAYRDKVKEMEAIETEEDNDEDEETEDEDSHTSSTSTALPLNPEITPTLPVPVLLQESLTNNGKLQKPISNTIPPVLRPQNGVTSWCSPSFILTGVELNGGIQSGPSKILGNVSTIQECVSECCRVPDCTVAYTEGKTCYAVLCLNQNICQARISTPSKSLGYVVRNGWSLFPSEQNAFKGAAFLNTQRPEIIPDTTLQTTTTTTSTPTSTVTTTFATTTLATTPLTTTTEIPKNVSIDISSITPESTINKTETCRSNRTLTDHRFVAGMKAGIFTDHGELSDVDDMPSCVKYCCLDKLCDVAYMVGRRCYTLQCFNRQTCQTFPAPNFFLNPVIAFVVRTKPPKVDIISVDFIKHNYTVPLTNSTFRNSSMTDKPRINVKLSKKTMDNSNQPSNENDEFVEDQIESGSGSGMDSPGFTRGNVPDAVLDQFEKTQERLPQPTERYYFPLSDVDSNVIKSLSDDKDFTECSSTKYGCEHFCITLLHGGPRCMCRNGYQLALDGQHCLYEGECEPKAHGCDQACKFVTDGFQCQCRSGYVLKKTAYKSSCQDLDECAMDMHSCSHSCLNTAGSYVCQCPGGYQLGTDRLTCQLIGGSEEYPGEALWKKSNIPSINNNVTNINQSLTIPPKILSIINTTEVTQGDSIILQCKTQGSPEPITVWTFGENFTTIAIGYGRFTMLPGGDLMITEAQMQDTGKYTCISGNVGGTDTASGYLLVNDVDECVTGKHNCSHLCTNTYGGFECSCYQGYTLLADQSTCQDVNECEMFNDCDHFCWNTEGSYTCGCRHGYQLQEDNKICKDIDECTMGSHQCEHNCTNTQGSYFCSCNPGFNLSSIDHVTCKRNEELTNKTIPVHHGNHTLTTRNNIHPHMRSGRTTRRVLHLITIITLVVTLILVSLALYLMWRNYKKRWRMKEATSNMNEPPVRSRCSAMFSWK